MFSNNREILNQRITAFWVIGYNAEKKRKTETGKTGLKNRLDNCGVALSDPFENV